jgi:hypothetical protein
MMGFTLNEDELWQLTGRRRGFAQCKQLQSLGVPFNRRMDGRPVVARAAAEQAMGVRQSPERREVTLNFEDL